MCCPLLFSPFVGLRSKIESWLNGRAVSPLPLGMRDIRREALHATEIYTAAIANI